ncbi:MAG: PAS domain S-box protein [Candidatus Lokiarchaeota archaeon]|nr:PAS domain S-box protein [Candidatus Lokiarchaeota archaeon]
MTSPNNEVNEKFLFQDNYKLLFDNTPISIVLIDFDGKIVEVNSATLNLFGSKRENLIDLKFTDLYAVPENEMPRMKKIFTHLFSGGIFGPEDIQIHNQDKKLIWVNVIASKIELDKISYIQVLTQDISQRKILEREVNESEKRYRGLYESSPNSLTVTNSKGVILNVNSATEKIFGYTKREVIGKKFTDLGIYSPEQFEIFKNNYKETLAGKKIEPQDIKIKRKNGTFAWINVQNSLKKINGEILVEGIAQDITDRKSAEKKLRESEERYRNLADSLPEVIFEINLSFTLTYTNSIASKVFGYTSQEFKEGRTIFDFVPLEDKESLLKQTKQIFRGEYLKPLQTRLRRKDGTFFFAHIHASRIFKDKSVSGVRCIIHDITDLKNTQKKIKESEEKYRLLSENANDLITVVDNDLKIDYINEKAHKRLMGYSSADFIGKTALDFVHPEDRKLIIKAFNEGDGSIEVRIKKKNGRYVWMESSGKFYKNPDGKNYVLTISRDISERKEAAQKLIESEKKYKELANSLPEVIFEIDLKFKLVYTNAIASKIFGYSHEEFKKGLNVFDFILEGDRDEVIRNLSLIFRGKTVDPLIMQLKKKDGTIFYGSLNATPIYKGTTIIGMRSIIHDVTEMVKAEERIKESEEQFRTISEQSLMGISIIQEESVKYVNKTLAHILGYSLEEMLNWGQGEFFKTIHPEDKKKVIEFATKIENQDDAVVQYYEARGIHRDGNTIWLEVYNKQIKFQNKPAFLVSYIDITERKKAKEELRQSEEKYRFLFEKSPVSILLINTKGKIVDCNPALEKLIEYDRTELIGHKFSNLSFILPKYLPQLLKRLKQISDGENIPSIHIQLIKKDGSLIWVNYESSLVKMGEKRYIMVMGHDISDTKELEIKLMQLNEMRKEFIDRASHELKTPITTVYGAYQLLDLLHKDKFNPEQLELLEMASIGTKRIKKLVDDLLDVSLLESKTFKVNKSRTDLSNIIINCIKEMKYFSNKRNHEIDIDILPELNMNIDESRIELVFTNLISNAIKYTPSNGKIQIKMQSDGKFAQVKISDSGVGLSSEEIKALFKKFSTIESSLKKDLDMDLGSTGLGLFLSKEIINLHGGEIWAESEGKGKGSTFIVKIPIGS